MTWKISVLRGTKLKPELREITTVVSDAFVVPNGQESRGLFSAGDAVIFYNEERSLFSADKITIVASLPNTEAWIVEQV